MQDLRNGRHSSRRGGKQKADCVSPISHTTLRLRQTACVVGIQARGVFSTRLSPQSRLDELGLEFPKQILCSLSQRAQLPKGLVTRAHAAPWSFGRQQGHHANLLFDRPPCPHRCWQNKKMFSFGKGDKWQRTLFKEDERFGSSDKELTEGEYWVRSSSS